MRRWPPVDSLRGGRAGPKKVMVGVSGTSMGHPPEKATLEPGGVVRLGDVRTRFLDAAQVYDVLTGQKKNLSDTIVGLKTFLSISARYAGPRSTSSR